MSAALSLAAVLPRTAWYTGTALASISASVGSRKRIQPPARRTRPLKARHRCRHRRCRCRCCRCKVFSAAELRSTCFSAACRSRFTAWRKLPRQWTTPATGWCLPRTTVGAGSALPSEDAPALQHGLRMDACPPCRLLPAKLQASPPSRPLCPPPDGPLLCHAPAGWVLSHDALRLDLADLQRLLDALQAQAAAGRPLQRWQLQAAQAAWAYHAHMLTVHHDTEERERAPGCLAAGLQRRAQAVERWEGGAGLEHSSEHATCHPAAQPSPAPRTACAAAPLPHTRVPRRAPPPHPEQSSTSRCCARGSRCRPSRAPTTSASWA